MSAIEYGSYYWGIVLHAARADAPGTTVHLHADQMKIDTSGALVFTSVGRRPAGASPDQKILATTAKTRRKRTEKMRRPLRMTRRTLPATRL